VRKLLLLIPALFLAPGEDAITEISLERTPCYGTCPIDKAVFRSNGTAEYSGTEHVERRGNYKGKIGKDEFEKLARLVAEKKFFDLKDAYSKPITDHPTLITTVKRGKAEKKVSNYADAAPKGLGEIEKKVIEVMEKTDWKKSE
jgi:hypothetical protein